MLAVAVDAHPAAAPLLSDVPAPTTPEEAADTERDRAIARRPRRVPPSLYASAAVEVTADPPLVLYDLRDVGNRAELERLAEVQKEMRCHGFRQLDKSAVLSEFRSLTQTIARHVMLMEPGGASEGGGRPAGIVCDSRHAGTLYALFIDRLVAISVIVRNQVVLAPDQPDVARIAAELHLVP